MSGPCPVCGAVSGEYEAAITYRPDPNDGQQSSDDIPTDDLPLIVGVLCTECGTVTDSIVHPGSDSDA